MDIKEILTKCDNTLLKQTATWEEIIDILNDAMAYECASACIPPCYVSRAKKYVGNALPICTVIGFPNGNCSRVTKCIEAALAVADGADEIDMVINIGAVKAGDYDEVFDEVNAVKAAIGDKTLKVIIEVCLLTDEEIIYVSRVLADSNCDFVKTSTGFSSGGATVKTVKLIKENCGEKLVKAAGGISSFEDAEKMIGAGADRLGTSRLVKIIKEKESK